MAIPLETIGSLGLIAFVASVFLSSVIDPAGWTYAVRSHFPTAAAAA